MAVCRVCAQPRRVGGLAFGSPLAFCCANFSCKYISIVLIERQSSCLLFQKKSSRLKKTSAWLVLFPIRVDLRTRVAPKSPILGSSASEKGENYCMSFTGICREILNSVSRIRVRCTTQEAGSREEYVVGFESVSQCSSDSEQVGPCDQRGGSCDFGRRRGWQQDSVN